MNASRRAAASLALAALLAVSGVACSSSSKGGASGDFCTKIKSYQSDSNLGMDTDSASVKKVKAALEDLANSAPDSLRDDVNTVKDAVEPALDAEANHDNKKLESLSASMDSPKFKAATKALDDYTKNTCGISETGS